MHVTIYGCEPDEATVFRELAPGVGITPVITAAPVSSDTIGLAGGSRSISVSHKTRITNAHLTQLREAGVRYVSTRSIGYNHLDVLFAESIGITVKNVAYSPDSVADHTIMLMLMALRNAKSVVLSASVHDYRLAPTRGKELRDLTVGVVGTGRIGSAVIDRLRGFGCGIVASDTRQVAAVEYLPFDQVLQRSDLVTLHMPLDEGTHHLLDARAFDLLKPGSFIVNTSRGGLIDSAALLDALQSGRVGGAALDVIEGEEAVFYRDRRGQQIDDDVFARLHHLANVTITPHNAFYTERALTDTVANSLLNCLRFEKGAQHA